MKGHAGPYDSLNVRKLWRYQRGNQKSPRKTYNNGKKTYNNGKMGQKNKYCSTKILLIRIRYGTPVSEMSRNICVRDVTEHMCQRCHGTYVSEMPRNIRVRDVTEHLSEMPRNTCVRDGHGTPVLKMPRSTCVRDATEHLCQRWPWICSVCRSHNCALLNSVISYYLIFHKTTTTDATIRTGSN